MLKRGMRSTAEGRTLVGLRRKLYSHDGCSFSPARKGGGGRVARLVVTLSVMMSGMPNRFRCSSDHGLDRYGSTRLGSTPPHGSARAISSPLSRPTVKPAGTVRSPSGVG